MSNVTVDISQTTECCAEQQCQSLYSHWVCKATVQRSLFVREQGYAWSAGNLFSLAESPCTGAIYILLASNSSLPPIPLLSCNLRSSDSTAKVQWESAYPSHYPNLPPLFGST